MTDVVETGGATPPSIAKFARLWFAATGFWLIGTTLTWDRTQARLERDPAAAEIALWAQPALVTLVLAMTLMQWWLITRRASRVGKWMVLIVGGIALLRGLFYLRDLGAHPLTTGVMLLAAAFDVWAASMLLRDDARVWFGDIGEPEA